MDDALRDAYARVGRKVVPSRLRSESDRWADLDDQQRAAIIADISLFAEILYPLSAASRGAPE